MPIDYNDYPANWLTEIRPRILARDKHRCKFCNVPNQLVIKRLKGTAWRKPCGTEWDMVHSSIRSGYSYSGALRYHGFTKVVLTIAHLDHDHTNTSDRNLAALCQRCHLKHDGTQHANNRKYGRNWKRNQTTLIF